MSGGAATCDKLIIHSGATTTIANDAALTTSDNIEISGTLTINGGTVTITPPIDIYKPIIVNSGGIFDQNGGTVTITGTGTDVISEADFITEAGSTVNISGGVFNIGSDWKASSTGTAKGTIALSGGYITVSKDCFLFSTLF